MFKKQTQTLIIKAATVAALMILFLLLGSHTCSKSNRLECIGLNFSYPVSFYKEKDEVKIYSIKDTILIFYYSDYILYRLSGTKKFETGENIRGTEPYFIFNKKNKSGFLFSSLKDSGTGTKFPIDSFLANRGMRGKDFEVPVDSAWSLAEVIKDKENNILEKYALIRQGDETSIDSIYYYYAKKMNDIEYSFSKKLDSIKAMKLYKIRMLYNERFSPSNNMTLPKRDILFEIRTEAVSNSKEIIDFIEKFQKCCDN